jgi:hypothetical protein
MAVCSFVGISEKGPLGHPGPGMWRKACQLRQARQPPRFGGTPLVHQCSSASTNASWPASSATPRSPSRAASAARIRVASSHRPSPARRHRPRSQSSICLRPPLNRHLSRRWHHRTCTRGSQQQYRLPASALRVPAAAWNRRNKAPRCPWQAVANQMQIALISAGITALRSGSGTVQDGGMSALLGRTSMSQRETCVPSGAEPSQVAAGHGTFGSRGTGPSTGSLQLRAGGGELACAMRAGTVCPGICPAKARPGSKRC